MSLSETYSGLYEFFLDDLYATVEVKESGDGWVSEWWVSRNLGSDLGVQLIGYVRVPVFGETKDDALRRLGFVYETVMAFVRDTAGGFGSVGTGNDVAGAKLHCKAHLQVWLDVVPTYNRTETTAMLYSLAVDFGVNNPAALIAEVEVIGVRAVHERIAYARRIGLLDSYGKGRIRPAVDVSEVEQAEVQAEIDKPVSGFRIRRDGVWYDYDGTESEYY